MIKKRCSTCGKKKTLNEFTKDLRAKDGLKGQCRQCRSKYAKQYRTTEGYKKSQKKYLKSKKKQTRDLKQYNLTLEDYDKMFEKQKGVCAICGQPEDSKVWGTVRRLSVDHDHKTGKVRGLLCVRCNRGIGYFQDNVRILAQAISYLK